MRSPDVISRRSFLAASPALLLLSRKAPTMPSELDYQANASVVLDGSGAGSVTFNGPPSLTSRRLGSLVVSTTPATPRPSVIVYRGSIAPASRIGATRLGDSDTLTNDGEVLRSGEPLIVVVTGGAASAVFSANLYGTDLRA